MIPRMIALYTAYLDCIQGAVVALFLLAASLFAAFAPWLVHS